MKAMVLGILFSLGTLVGLLRMPAAEAQVKSEDAAKGEAKVGSAAVHAGGQVDVFSGTDRNSVQISSSRFR